MITIGILVKDDADNSQCGVIVNLKDLREQYYPNVALWAVVEQLLGDLERARKTPKPLPNGEPPIERIGGLPSKVNNMGQAKRRGTVEERQAAAIARNRALEANLELAENKGLKKYHAKYGTQRLATRLAATGLLVAALPPKR